ncbi:hypothetical protein C2845_PM06G05920 [Panicum miliaceum]|uniref:Uncharacterized protein n=1 Tax=Panicum miliaceum TaxID=4540 RepID=A0A3L6RD86_PANMI|nr:hypothetical protein C2845_PM06G05920 [Panicum miliaceum]
MDQQEHRAVDVVLPASGEPQAGDGTVCTSVNCFRPQVLKYGGRLVVDTGDGTIVEIPLNNGSLILPGSGPTPEATGGRDAAQGTPVDGEDADEDDKAYLDKMRGRLMTVATLFIGMAFQAAAHQPSWMPRTKDWLERLFGEHAHTAGGGVSEGQALTAFTYHLLNAVTFSLSLALMLSLLSTRVSSAPKFTVCPPRCPSSSASSPASPSTSP